MVSFINEFLGIGSMTQGSATTTITRKEQQKVANASSLYDSELPRIVCVNRGSVRGGAAIWERLGRRRGEGGEGDYHSHG